MRAARRPAAPLPRPAALSLLGRPAGAAPSHPGATHRPDPPRAALHSKGLRPRWVARLGLAMGNGRNTNLRTLDLALNALALESELDYRHFAEFSVAVARHDGLRTLNLSYNQLGLEAAKLLATAVAGSATLRSLELHGNRLGPAGAAELGKGLAVATSLQQLDLSENDLGDEGAGKVAVMLVMNKSLLSLKLERNWIGDAGALQLGSALAKNKTLVHLSLADNDLCDILRRGFAVTNGIRRLCSAEAGQGLTSLDLSSSHVGPQGAAELCRALSRHPTLTELKLVACGIDSEASTDIMRLVMANPRLERLHLYRNPLNWGALNLDEDAARRVVMFEGV